jgi:hypothetical protein
MLILLGLVMAVAATYGLFQYLQGYFVNRLPKWFDGVPFILVLLAVMLVGLWLAMTEALPPPKWLNEPPVQKENSCGRLPVSS